MVEQLLTNEKTKVGQSLVEFALTLPVLLLVLAGVLEVANVLTIQNRVQQAAREGARFGAGGGSDQGILEIIGQAGEGSLAVDDTRMDVWVIRPVVDTDTWTWIDEDSDGDPWGVDEVCVFGDGCPGSPVDSNPVSPNEVLTDIQTPSFTSGNPDNLDNTRFVVVIVKYDADTILNLPFFQAPGQEGNRIPIWSHTAMIQEVDQTTVENLQSGCTSYSMAIEMDNLVGLSEGDTVTINYNDFHQTGGTNRTGVGFTSWQYDHADSANYVHANGSPVFGSMWAPGTAADPVLGFIEYQSDDPAGDTQMHRGDWVLINKDTVPGADQPLDNHIDAGRQLRVIVYDEEPGNPGQYQHNYGHTDGPPNLGDVKWMYRIDAFAVVRILEYDNTGSGSANTITFEFIRWNNSCGYDQ